MCEGYTQKFTGKNITSTLAQTCIVHGNHVVILSIRFFDKSLLNEKWLQKNCN